MRRRETLLSAAVAAALTMPATALAQVDTSDWKCEYCPFDKQYRAEYDAGVSALRSEDGYRYGNGTGYDDEGLYGEFGWNGRYVGEQTDAHWNFRDIGLDSRSITIDISRAGNFDVGLSWQQLPYRRFDTTTSPFARNRAALQLPSGWVPASTTSGMTQLASSSRPVNIEHDREILGFGAAYMPTKSVRLYADYRHTQRDGIRIASGSNFTSAALLPRVLDDETDEIDAGIRYASGGLSLSLAWYGSFYRNALESLTWDNPFMPIPGASAMRLATEPDNDFTQVSLSGVYRSDFANTVVAFSAATGQGEQTADLLPYTINSSLAPPALPVSSLDGKVDTTNYALTVTSKPFRGARVKLAYRHDERDNQTPVSTWTRVITDSFVTTDAEENIPYSFDRSRLNLSGSYKLFDTVTVSAGYDRTELDRDFQEVASQTEDSGWGKLRWRPTAYLEATFKGGESTREVDDYDTDVAVSFGQNPLMRKYNLAYRYREFGEVSLQASLPQKPLSVGVTYLYADDNYSRSELGMLESTERRLSFDVSWAILDSSSVYLTAGGDGIDATQMGSETLAGPVWTAAHEDEFSHVGGGIRLNDIGGGWDVALEVTRSLGETEIIYSGAAVSAEQLPDLKSTMNSLRFSVGYRASERLRWDLVVRGESFEADDWALDGVDPDTVPSVLTLGADAYDYDVWAVGLGFRYRTGD